MSQGKLIGSVMAALAKFERDLRKRIRSGVAAARVRRADVLVPANMLEPNATARNGGVVALDLTTFTTNPISQIPDANRIAVTQLLQYDLQLRGVC
jgi:hypothetical protein